MRVACARSLPSYRPVSDAAPGTACGNHRANFPRHVGTFPGMVFAVQLHELLAIAGARSFPFPPYKRGSAGSNPVAPTKFLQLDGLFETLIGGQVTTVGNHRCVLPHGNPPSVAVLRADRAGGDTKTPRSRRALKLAQMAVGALREWQVDQAAEREAAGSHWRDTGRAFTHWTCEESRWLLGPPWTDACHGIPSSANSVSAELRAGQHQVALALTLGLQASDDHALNLGGFSQQEAPAVTTRERIASAFRLPNLRTRRTGRMARPIGVLRVRCLRQ